MADKELRRMRRSELIEIIFALKTSEENVRKEKEALEERLHDRTIQIAKAGSIADASLALNGVFEAAQIAADDYLNSIKAANENPNPTQDIIEGAEREAAAILELARTQAEELIAAAKGEAYDLREARAEQGSENGDMGDDIGDIKETPDLVFGDEMKTITGELTEAAAEAQEEAEATEKALETAAEQAAAAEAAEAILAQARAEADAMRELARASAEEEARICLEDAEERSRQLLADTEAECERKRQEAQEQISAWQAEFERCVNEALSKNAELAEILYGGGRRSRRRRGESA